MVVEIGLSSTSTLVLNILSMFSRLKFFSTSSHQGNTVVQCLPPILSTIIEIVMTDIQVYKIP